MRQENPDTCRAPLMAATASTNLSSDSPMSHFICIAMRGLEPKLRIKIPKLLLKTMHRKFHIISSKDSGIANDSDNRSTRRAKDVSQFPKKVVSVFSNAFGNRKSPGKCFSNGEKSGLASEDGKEASSNNLMRVGLPILAAILSEPESADEGNQNRKETQPEKIDLPLLSFSDKKKGWSCIKSKMKKTRVGDCSKDAKVGRKRSFSSRPLVMVPKLKMITKSLQKKVKKRFERDDKNGEEDEDGELLWKKRILMGGRCKPLKDDEDGLSLPEMLFSA